MLTNLEALRLMEKQLDRVADPTVAAGCARAMLRALVADSEADRPAWMAYARALLQASLPADDRPPQARPPTPGF